MGSLERSLAFAHQLLRQGRRDLHDHEREKTRTYNKFSDFANDIVNVRIYHGVHFRFADVAAREQGEKVAD